MIKLSTEYLTEFSQAEAAEVLCKDTLEQGVYRFVYESGAIDVDFLGNIEWIQIDDIDPLRDEFYLTRERGIIMANDNDECAPAQYILVGDY